MATVIQFRRGSHSYMAGEGSQIVLQEGEPFLEYPDTGIGTPGSKLKIGDGVNKYCNLPYLSTGDSSGSDTNQQITKIRYTLINSQWSESPDSNGYYTYNLRLSTALDSIYQPNVYIAGATDNTFPNDVEEIQYKLLKHILLVNKDNLKLYATDKPTVSFYVFIEGLEAKESE